MFSSRSVFVSETACLLPAAASRLTSLIAAIRSAGPSVKRSLKSEHIWVSLSAHRSFCLHSCMTWWYNLRSNGGEQAMHKMVPRSETLTDHRVWRLRRVPEQCPVAGEALSRQARTIARCSRNRARLRAFLVQTKQRRCSLLTARAQSLGPRCRRAHKRPLPTRDVLPGI